MLKPLLALTLAGVSPHSPEVQAIRRALRAVNLAGGIEKERKEEGRVYPAGGPRFGQPPAASGKTAS